MNAIVIVLQMFIAVINENFQVAEEQKRSQQATRYLASHNVQTGTATWMRRLNPYRWVKANPEKAKTDLPSNLVLPMQKALVQDYGGPFGSSRGPNSVRSSFRTLRHFFSKLCSGPKCGQRYATRVAPLHQQVFRDVAKTVCR